MKKWKEALAILLTLVLLLTGLGLAADLLRPHRADFGSNWSGFLQEPEDSLDVLVLGSSMVYCDVIPAVIYEQTGLKTYLVTGPEQTMALSYYALREACRTQRPQAVALELSALFYYPYYEHNSLINVSYMPCGLNRLGAMAAGVEPDEWGEALLPILSYHDRWYTVEGAELKENLRPRPDLWAGYTLLEETELQGGVQELPEVQDWEYDRALGYLRKLAAYCEEKEIQLLLYRTPTLRVLSADEEAKMERDLETVPHNGYRDFRDLQFDAKAHWHDARHLNCGGAEVFTPYFAEFLTESGVKPQAPGGEELWRQRVEAWNALP